MTESDVIDDDYTENEDTPLLSVRRIRRLKCSKKKCLSAVCIAAAMVLLISVATFFLLKRHTIKGNDSG